MCPDLPGCDLAQRGVGAAADEVGRDVHRVHIGKKASDLARRHAARMNGDDLVIKASKAALMLANELRLEATRAVAGNVDAQSADVGEDDLGALAVATIGASPFGLGLTGRIAQVVTHFGAQHALQCGLLELLEDALKLGQRHRPGDQLFKCCG